MTNTLEFLPRLLNQKQAAFYCGMSVNTFKKIITVKPLLVGSLKLFDRFKLDEWIENNTPNTQEKDWLAEIEDDNIRAH